MKRVMTIIPGFYGDMETYNKVQLSRNKEYLTLKQMINRIESKDAVYIGESIGYKELYNDINQEFMGASIGVTYMLDKFEDKIVRSVHWNLGWISPLNALESITELSVSGDSYVIGISYQLYRHLSKFDINVYVADKEQLKRFLSEKVD